MLSAAISFSLFAALLTITPGLDTMLVIRTAAVSGRRAGFAVGIGTGCLCWAAASGLGITALLTASQVGYDVMRWVGAAYLFYLGVRALVRTRHGDRSVVTEVPRRTAAASFRIGLMTNLLNPKIGVFYLAALPQFLPRGMAPLWPSLLFGLLHDVEGIIWFTALILLVGRVGVWFARADVRRWLDRLTGIVFIGFGARLALEKAR